MKSLVVFAIPCQKCDCECWDFGADSTVPNTTCISVREAFAIHTKPFSMSLLGAADPETSALNVLQILIFGVWFRVMRLRSGCSAIKHCRKSKNFLFIVRSRLSKGTPHPTIAVRMTCLFLLTLRVHVPK